jgi:hypothetical protein
MAAISCFKSTVKNPLAIAGREALEDIRIASIGPVTASALRAHGLKVDAEAKQFRLDGLVEAILTNKRLPKPNRVFVSNKVLRQLSRFPARASGTETMAPE